MNPMSSNNLKFRNKTKKMFTVQCVKSEEESCDWTVWDDEIVGKPAVLKDF